MFVQANAVMSEVSPGPKCVEQAYSLGQGMQIILFYGNVYNLKVGKTVYALRLFVFVCIIHAI